MIDSEGLRLVIANAQRPEFAAMRDLVDAEWKAQQNARLLRLARDAEMKCFRESPEGAAMMASIEDHVRRSGGDS